MRIRLAFNVHALSICVILIALASVAASQDPGWPRKLTQNGAQLICYQPQVDEWKDFKELDARMAVSLTPGGEKPKVGVVALRFQTQSDSDSRTVALSNAQITRTSFPGASPQDAERFDKMVRSFLPPDKTITISLDRLVATVNKPKEVRATPQMKNDPPQIFVSYSPAILLMIDGDPVRVPVEKTGLEFVANANWPLFFEKSSSTFFLYGGDQWMKSAKLEGPWTSTQTLPNDMKTVAADPDWGDLKDAIPPKKSGAAPQVFVGKEAELILFKGKPAYQAIPSTQLSYPTNTESDLFLHNPTKTYYYLTRGRWFSAKDLSGPWTFATTNLPPDFAKIPRNHPASDVLSSVPGTPEAADAVLLAQVPNTIVVNPAEAAKQVDVKYTGEPQFKPIENTSLSYAVNTPEKVIKVGDLYYLCFQGVWFMSNTPNGPWKTATSVPKEIYEIPASSPVYNVTYVTQKVTDDGDVECSHTAGYTGAFIFGATMGAVLAWGTGYYYPPYYGWYGGYPVYYGYPRTYGYGGFYNSAWGYGGARGVYGPYGGATWGAAYNPSTGRYSRGATAYGPYGSRSAGRSYNPYTGAYGATRQGSNAYSNWGSSVVGRGNQAAVTRHYSDARGTVGSVRTSSGGAAVGAAGGGGRGVVGRTAGGDMYAGRDGNVYRNNNGNWQQYNNGNWNSVNKPAADAGSRASSFSGERTSATTQSLQQDRANRQRGAQESQRFSNAQRSSGSFGGRSGGTRSGGFRGGGGRRR